MYERIVVALDGSELAERVLPHVEALAEKFGSAVTLLRATAPRGAIPIDSAAVGVAAVEPESLVEAERGEAAEYLGRVAARLRARGLAVEVAQPEGAPAPVIVEHARGAGADLIALGTHGRGGAERLLLGSVADEVLRHAACPILLVRAE